MGDVMFINSEKQWHRFWQQKRNDVNVVCMKASLIDKPLFGKVFDRYAFFDRVLKHYNGILIVVEDNGYYVVSRQYIGFFPKERFDGLENTCENENVDIQLLFDTLLNRFIKEV